MPLGNSVTCNMVIMNIEGVHKIILHGDAQYIECEGDTKYPRLFCMGIQYFVGYQISCDPSRSLSVAQCPGSKKGNLRASEEGEEAIEAATKAVSKGRAFEMLAKHLECLTALGCLLYTCKHRKNDEQAPPPYFYCVQFDS